MNQRLGVAILLLQSVLTAAIVQDVRAALGRQDVAGAETQLAQYRQQNGITPEWLEAHSWLGRGALAAKQLDKADAYAAETRKLVLTELKKRPLDADRNTPIALGASIEVQAQVMGQRGERSAAVAFLQRELKSHYTTSIRTRIQKNIHLLSLEGKPAPALELKQWLGPKPSPVATLKGKPLLLFFWAHWCGDCKYQGPILAKLKSEFGPQGLVLLAPTQRYGYVAGGEEAAPAPEVKYIDQVRHQFYPDLTDVSAPVSEENFKNYGASTTPTLVLVDRSGIVRLYHPGKMTYEALREKLVPLVGADKAS